MTAPAAGRLAGLHEAAAMMREREAWWQEAEGDSRTNTIIAGTFAAAARIIEGHAELVEGPPHE